MTDWGHDTQERHRFVEDLLSYMTLEEKIGQLNLAYDRDDPALEKAIAEGRVGGVAGADAPARLQQLATDHSRLGIPLLLVAPDGPREMSPWALAASWDESLAREVGARTARAASEDGFNCVAAPRAAGADAAPRGPVDVAACETHLTARLAAAIVAGAAQPTDDPRGAVLAVPSWHAQGGGDEVAWSLAVAQAGSVAAIDSPALTRQIAQRAGFSGLLVAECRQITERVRRNFAASSAPSAVEATERLIAAGALSEIEIEMAVRGVLAAKHGLGLFRDPQRVVGPVTGRTRAGESAEAVRATFVLLRNEAGILPLSPVSDRVLVVGPPDGGAAACAGALTRAGIGFAMAPGLALRRDGESWREPAASDPVAISMSSDAARRADFALVMLEDRHFARPVDGGWLQPTTVTLEMLRALVMSGARLVAIIAVDEPVDLAAADQHFAAVLHCWAARDGFEEALGDVLSGRFSPQGRMPVSAGRYQSGHGLGYGESTLSRYALAVDGDRIVASVVARNGGAFAMRETVQVYAQTGSERPRLIAFDHVMLAPGTEHAVAIEIKATALGTPTEQATGSLTPSHCEIGLGKNIGRLTMAPLEITPAFARTAALRQSGFLRLAAG